MPRDAAAYQEGKDGPGARKLHSHFCCRAESCNMGHGATHMPWDAAVYQEGKDRPEAYELHSQFCCHAESCNMGHGATHMSRDAAVLPGGQDDAGSAVTVLRHPEPERAIRVEPPSHAQPQDRCETWGDQMVNPNGEPLFCQGREIMLSPSYNTQSWMRPCGSSPPPPPPPPPSRGQAFETEGALS